MAATVVMRRREGEKYALSPSQEHEDEISVHSSDFEENSDELAARKKTSMFSKLFIEVEGKEGIFTEGGEVRVKDHRLAIKLPPDEEKAGNTILKFRRVRKRLKDLAERKRKISRHIRKLLFFICFCIVFFYYNTYSDADQFYQVNALESLFDNGHVSDVRGIHKYIQEDVIQNYYTSSATLSSKDSERYLLGATMKVGAWRIGTLRVNEISCFEPKEFVDMFDEGQLDNLKCFGLGSKRNFHVSVENKSSYGSVKKPFSWKGWNGTDAAKERKGRLGFQYVPLSMETYASPAFSIIFPQTDGDGAMRTAAYLESSKYIDEYTAAVFVDLNFFNPSMNFLIVMRYIFQLTNAGGVIPYKSIEAVRPSPLPFQVHNILHSKSRIMGVFAWLEMAFYLVFWLSTVYKILRRGCSQWLRYLRDDTERMLQIVNELAYLACWLFRLNAYSNMPKIYNLKSEDTFYLTRAYSQSMSFENMLISICMLTVSLRLVFLFSIVRSISLVTNTMVNSLSVIFPVISIVMVLVFTFALAFMKVFNTKLAAFKDFSTSFYSIMLNAQGEFDFDELRQADNMFGPLFFFIANIILSLIIFNFFIAIVSDGYVSAKDKLVEDADVHVGNEIYRWFLLRTWSLPCIGKRLKTAYINYGQREKTRLREKKMYESELDSLKNNQLKSPTKMLREQANIDDEKERHAQRNRILIAKTAAKQTLKELRQLSREVHRLSRFIRDEGSTNGSHRQSLTTSKGSAYVMKEKTKKNKKEKNMRDEIPGEVQNEPQDRVEGEVQTEIAGHRVLWI